MVITRMRWEAVNYSNNKVIDNSKEESAKLYGLKPPYSPRQVIELIPFENDLVELIRNIKLGRLQTLFWEILKRASY